MTPPEGPPASTPDWRAALAAALGDRVAFDEPLAPRVAFRIGGPADALVRPMTIEELRTALAIARAAGVPVTVLGTGSNVLVADRGIRGVTIRLSGELADVHIGGRPAADFSPALRGGGASTEDLSAIPDAEATPRVGAVEIEAGAGALNAPLVALALSLRLVGIEFLATIPGTFGGALIMNAGAHGGEIGGFVRSVTLIDRALEVVTREGGDAGFAYRSSGFQPGEIITGATLVVPSGDSTKAREHLRAMRQARKRTQPTDQPNAGSIFKNPPNDYAGRLIEACGLKGRRRGGAMLSELHANFIVNVGEARASDVQDLAEEAKIAVRGAFGIDLEWEVRRIGDW